MTKEKFTWYDLKRFCDNLKPIQLGYEVKAWGDHKAFTLKGVEQLEDDFIDLSGEGMEPVSFYKNTGDEENKQFWEEWGRDEPILAFKGEPMLIID